MSETIITKDNFQKEVLDSSIPVLIDFFATWCGPCMMLSPILEEIANENEGKIKVCKVNVDEENELAFSFKVDSIPALFAIKDGKVINSSIGFTSKEAILKMF